jgi:hypothetical protein
VTIIEPDEAFIMPEELESSYPVYAVPWKQICEELADLGLTEMEEYSDRPDNVFYHTDEEALRKMLPFITFERKPFPQTERKDCDEYTAKSSADLRFRFGIMGLRIHGWYKSSGMKEEELHAFCGSRTQYGKWLFWEPNRGLPASGLLFGMKNGLGYRPIRWKT